MPKFRKKPVVIEAHKYLQTTEANPNHDEYVRRLAEWCDGETGSIEDLSTGETTPFIAISTLEGTMSAKPGDWIIKGVNGEFYPCKDDIFQQTYEVVSDE